MNLHENLLTLGWSTFFERQLSADGEATDLVPARVISEQREHYRLLFGDGTSVWGEITGKIRHDAKSRVDFPGVGDWVLVTLPPSREQAVICRVLNRRTCLARKAAGEKEDSQILATNIDTVFVLTSLNQELNLRRIERYLVMIAESGARPVILLTKSDLVEDAPSRVGQVRAVAGDSPVFAVSPKTGAGIDSLNEFIKSGTTSVLVGSSGVGKSTFINRLAGNNILKTQEVRGEDAKGRHTTTTRELILLSNGGMLIDTPGIRELQLADSGGLQDAFFDIEEFALKCKFTDCTHENEPGCHVKTALASGEITTPRWESYQKLQREMLATRRRNDKAFASEEKTKMKKEQKAFKRYGKRKPR